MISPITASEAHNYRMAAEFCGMKQETGGSPALKIYSLPQPLYLKESGSEFGSVSEIKTKQIPGKL
jgi:hypothetical protein